MHNVYEVWHRIDPDFRNNTDVVLDAFPEGFIHVADVETDDVGRVFELTNSIDRPWWENAEVTFLMGRDGGARSTSVGDVIVKALPAGIDANGTPRWARFSVERIGFRSF